MQVILSDFECIVGEYAGAGTQVSIEFSGDFECIVREYAGDLKWF